MKKKVLLRWIIGLCVVIFLYFVLRKYYFQSSDTTALEKLVSWVVSHGYFLFFVAAFFEGPLVSTAAGVACSLGYYNIEIIILLSILGDLCPDAVFYSIGYFGGRPLLHRYGRYIGMTEPRIEKMKKLLHHHLRKTIVAVKLAPLIPVPGIIVIGSLRAPVLQFIETSLLITVPKSLFFVLLGYYSGKAYQHVGGIIANSEIVIFILAVIIIGIFLFYQRATFSLSEKIEDLH